MNDPNKANQRPSSNPTVEFLKNNPKLRRQLPILKLSYLEYLKQQYCKEIQTKKLEENRNRKMLNGRQYKWKIFKLEANSANIEEIEEEPIPQEEYPNRKNIFKEFIKQKADLLQQTFEFLKQDDTQEEIEDKEVDGFLWVPDPEPDPLERKKQSLRWKLRKHFLQNPEIEVEKHMDGEDYMIDDFVVIDPDLMEDLHEENKLKEGLIDLSAGSLAGIVQVYVSQPLDTVKVKQQTFPALYKNMFKCFIQTYRRDGISRGLYAGSLPAVVASVAENSVLFAAYGYCQKAVAYVMDIEKVSEMSALGNAVAGFFAAFFSTFALCPTELVKCKLQAVQEMKQYVSKNSKAVPLSAFQLTRHIFVTEGVSGFYRGLTSTFVREMPGFFFFFGGYEATREYFTEPDQSKDDIGPLKTMCAGAVGGISLWTTTFPADVIKSRIQINNLKGSMISIGSDILRKEGILAFYNGLLSTILRTIPSTATLFLVYEYSKKVLNNRFDKVFISEEESER